MTQIKLFVVAFWLVFCAQHILNVSNLSCTIFTWKRTNSKYFYIESRFLFTFSSTSLWACFFPVFLCIFFVLADCALHNAGSPKGFVSNDFCNDGPFHAPSPCVFPCFFFVSLFHCQWVYDSIEDHQCLLAFHQTLNNSELTEHSSWNQNKQIFYPLCSTPHTPPVCWYYENTFRTIIGKGCTKTNVFCSHFTLRSNYLLVWVLWP